MIYSQKYVDNLTFYRSFRNVKALVQYELLENIFDILFFGFCERQILSLDPVSFTMILFLSEREVIMRSINPKFHQTAVNLALSLHSAYLHGSLKRI